MTADELARHPDGPPLPLWQAASLLEVSIGFVDIECDRRRLGWRWDGPPDYRRRVVPRRCLLARLGQLGTTAGNA